MGVQLRICGDDELFALVLFEVRVESEVNLVDGVSNCELCVRFELTLQLGQLCDDITGSHTVSGFDLSVGD